MISEIKRYFGLWWTIMSRPIYFYTVLEAEDWRKGGLSFLLITNWFLALAVAIVVFVLQYVPIGGTLLEKVAPQRTLIALPVLFVLGAVFFFITLFIAAGLFVAGMLCGFVALAYLLHLTYQSLGGKGEINRMLQNINYSSAALLPALLIFALIIITKYFGMSFALFRAGSNTIFCLLILYMYGLWAIAGRKIYGISKTMAFLGALMPVIVLLLFVFLFDKIVFPHLQPWIS